MNQDIVSRRVTRFFAGLMICIGALAGAAIGLAAVGNASSGAVNPAVPNPAPAVRGPLIVATPNHTAPQWVPAPRHRVVVMPSDFGGD